MKRKIINAELLALGVEALIKALTENPKDSAQDILDLVSENQTASAAAKTELETVKAELTATKQVNADLNKEIEELSSGENAGKAALTFELNGKKYGFEFNQMNHKGKVITSEIVVEDKELQAQLVKISSGMIKEL
jgi:cell division protein FtsB